MQHNRHIGKTRVRHRADELKRSG